MSELTINCQVCKRPIKVTTEQMATLETTGGYLTCPYEPESGHAPHCAFDVVSSYNKKTIELVKNINSQLRELATKKLEVVKRQEVGMPIYFHLEELCEFLSMLQHNTNTIINANKSKSLTEAISKMEEP